VSEEKYKNKYRIPTNRLPGYDYGSNGCYYVTICTKNREHYFGEIGMETDDGQSQAHNVETHNCASLHRQHGAVLHATEIGKIAEKFWSEIPDHYPFVILDQFVIMPNHIHGILFFNKNDVETHNCASPQPQTDNVQPQTPDVQTHNCASLRRCTSLQSNKFGPQSQNLGAVIRGFKSSLKRYANENNIDFAWQERFYDNIIRDNQGLNNVRQYIFNNPQNWYQDELNGENGNGN